MSSKLYQSPTIRSNAIENRGRNKGVMRSVREQKRLEAEARARHSDNVELSREIRKAISEKQPERYALFNDGSPSKEVLLRVDLDARNFRVLQAKSESLIRDVEL